MTEFGNLALVEEREPNEGGNVSVPLPGVRSGDMASRNVKPEVRVFALQFSPTGTEIVFSFCCQMIFMNILLQFLTYSCIQFRSSLVCGDNRRTFGLLS